MSTANETGSVSLPSETYSDTLDTLLEDNEPCWCIECGWDGEEDELMFTNDGVFVCPQCGSEDTDYFYSEESNSCVFCGSDDVVGVIDIVSLNEIHEATPLDKEQVYGYCARCADVKMAEGSTGDQIVSWEDGAGVSSPSMPPSDIKWAESKKERKASGRAMHYAIPSEKKYPIWDKAHARMALAWSQGTKYADKVEKAVTKRFPTMNAETVYRNYPGRKGPSLSATSVKRGTRKRGNDGKMWEVRKSGRSQRWFRGAESFEALGEPDAPYDQGYDDQQDESLGERNVTTGEQSLKDRRDEADAMDKKTGRKYHDVGTMDKGKTCPGCGTYGYWGADKTNRAKVGSGSGKYCPVCSGMVKGIDMGAIKKEVARHRANRANRAKKNLKRGARLVDGGPSPRLGKRKSWNPGVDPESRLVPESVNMDAEFWQKGLTLEDLSKDQLIYVIRNLEKMKFVYLEDLSDYDGSVSTVGDLLGSYGIGLSVGAESFGAENMGLTQYVGSAGGSSQGTPVSYGGIALPESDVASLVATDNPMDATIGTVTGTMGAEGWGKTCQVEDSDTDEPCTAPATINLQDILMEYEVGEDPYEKDHLGEINEFFCKKHYDEMDDMWAETKGSEHHKGQGYDDELDESLGMSHKESGMKQSFKDRRDESKGTEKFDHSRAYSRVKAMDAEEVPVVPDPSSFPQGYGRVLGQQTDQANLSPLHAEGDDVQMVKIQDPVMTGAKMALGVVALNATAIASVALIGLALTHAARKGE